MKAYLITGRHHYEWVSHVTLDRPTAEDLCRRLDEWCLANPNATEHPLDPLYASKLTDEYFGLETVCYYVQEVPVTPAA